jgi:hypothetical protein
MMNVGSGKTRWVVRGKQYDAKLKGAAGITQFCEPKVKKKKRGNKKGKYTHARSVGKVMGHGSDPQASPNAEMHT